MEAPQDATGAAAQHPIPNGNDSSDCDIDNSDDSDEQGTSQDRDRKLREYFAEGMRQNATIKSHRRVFVLLLWWRPEGKDYMDVGPEVKELRQVFEEVYNFKVYEKQLETGGDGRPNPAKKLNLYLAEFICESDDDSLLIVYYAGHGVRNVKRHDLVLFGGNPKTGVNQKEFSRIVWSRAETQLHQAKADKLLIFDCCYAGSLAREIRSFSRNIFEYIGSTQHNRTAVGPGDDSFTRALIWALKELADTQGGFTTMTLMEKIKHAPLFSDLNQVPVNSERGKQQSFYRLILAPLPSTSNGGSHHSPNSTDQAPESLSPSQSYLHLTFLLSQHPRKSDITTLTRHLCELAKDLPVKEVLWKGIATEDFRMSNLEKAASHFLYALNRRKSSAQKYDKERIAPLQVITKQDEGPAMSTDFPHSDDTLVDGLVESPIAQRDPHRDRTVIIEHMEHMDIHSDNVEAEIQNQYAPLASRQIVLLLLLTLMVGVVVAHGPQLLSMRHQELIQDFSKE